MTVRKPSASHCHRSQPRSGIQKLNLCFDLGKLQAAGVEARQLSVDQGVGFRSIVDAFLLGYIVTNLLTPVSASMIHIV